MTNRLLSFAMSGMLLFFACKKQVSPDCIQARIVRITCASVVMQSVNDETIGEDNWKDMYGNNAVYNNVFSVSNPCNLASEYKVGDQVYVTLGKPVVTDCVHCALYDAPPGAAYSVKSIGSLPCNSEE